MTAETLILRQIPVTVVSTDGSRMHGMWVMPNPLQIWEASVSDARNMLETELRDKNELKIVRGLKTLTVPASSIKTAGVGFW